MRRRPYYLTREGHLMPQPRPEPGWEKQWERWGRFRPRQEVLEAGEIYLELSELDLDNEDAIIAFCNRWGPLAISYGNPRYSLLRDVPDFRNVRPRLERNQPTKHARRKLAGTTAVPEAESMDEFRYGAACLRDLTTAWKNIQDRTDLTATTWQSFTTDAVPYRDSVRDLLNTFEGMLTRALTPFYPQVHLEIGGDQPGQTMPPRREWYTGGTVPLYATCCLELYNHLVEHAQYRYCANTNCHRLYVRQTGRAEHGQHRRSGTRYCSSHCARAQAQRDLRARRRAANPGAEQTRPAPKTQKPVLRDPAE
jgi:hypothetical protein